MFFRMKHAYHVALVKDGLHALHMVDMLKPVLFLFDYRLPTLDGIELYDQLHKRKGLANIPTIMINATLSEQEIRVRHLIGL